MKQKIYIESFADRDAVILALNHNGYITREGRDNRENKYKRWVEYWKEE
jgi:hypothetical protein